MKIWRSLHRAVRTHPALGRAALRAIPDIRWRLDVRGVGPMAIRLRRNRSFWLRDPLRHEAFMLGAMQRLIRPGDIVFDVGANIGLYSRLMVQRFGAGRVFAFEPAEQNQILLRKNIELGKCEDQIQIIGMALADYDGTDDFQTDDISTATGVLNVVTDGRPSEARRQYGLPARTERVAVRRVDTLVEAGALPAPDVIKVDVEGAEERLLRGATATLQRYSPKLAIEMHGMDVSRAVVRLLLNMDYSLFGYLSSGRGRAYKEIVIDDLDKIKNTYSLHHCIAARDRDLLMAPIELHL